MTDHDELSDFAKAAVHLINKYRGNKFYYDKDFYNNDINSYHCEEERRKMEKEEGKLIKLADRINALKKFDLI